MTVVLDQLRPGDRLDRALIPKDRAGERVRPIRVRPVWLKQINS